MCRGINLRFWVSYFSVVPMGIRSELSRLDGNQFLRKYAPVAEFVFLFVLVIADILYPYLVIITWQLVALITMLVVIPYIPLIKRVSYGDWEAKLETLVQSAELAVEAADVSEADTDVEKRASNLEEMLQRQLEEDPKVALAKLRMELEDVLKQFAVERGFDQDREYIRFHEVLEFLRDHADVMDRDLYQDIRRVREVANEAIHGGEVDRVTARRIVQVGIRVLERIYYEADTQVNTDPSVPAFSEQETDN